MCVLDTSSRDRWVVRAPPRDAKESICSVQAGPEGIWVASTRATVELWDVPRMGAEDGEREDGCDGVDEAPGVHMDGPARLEGPRILHGGDDCNTHVPRGHPRRVLPGRPGLLQCRVSCDRQHVVCSDTNGCIVVYHVPSLRVIRVIQPRPEEEHRSMSERMESEMSSIDGGARSAIPSWFTPDVTNGSLRIKLAPLNVCNAEVYARDAGLGSCGGPNAKVNHGEHLLRSLMPHLAGEQPLPLMPVVCGTSVVMHDARGIPVHRVAYRDPKGRAPKVSPTHVPPWVRKLLVDGVRPRTSISTKLSLVMSPLDRSVRSLPSPSITAHRAVSVGKLLLYIKAKLRMVVPNGVEVQQYVQLLCKGEPLDPQDDLATVQKFVWRSSTREMVLHYRLSPAHSKSKVRYE